ncbi:MAG TPA: class F sortase [Kineosporiaceae bacterium]|nr:class F sortase [Kineosporiaceae bacterium]
MQRPVLVLLTCLAVAIGVPTGWWATRPTANEGAAVTQVLRRPVSGPAQSLAAQPLAADSVAAASPDHPARVARLTARPADPPPPMAAATPTRVRVPGVGIDAIIEAVGVDAHGLVEVPERVDRVGWYEYGPAAGDPAGSAVLAGHVDTREQGAGAFFPLRNVSVGDRVVVTLSDGRVVAYRVVGKQTILKRQLPVAQIFARGGPPRLILITCGGPFIPALHSYQDNLVVMADPLTRASP